MGRYWSMSRPDVPWICCRTGEAAERCVSRHRACLRAPFTLRWNSGVVEGHVNRIKTLKRQMFGRAGFALLRKRVLLAP
jgi:transposase